MRKKKIRTSVINSNEEGQKSGQEKKRRQQVLEGGQREPRRGHKSNSQLAQLQAKDFDSGSDPKTLNPPPNEARQNKKQVARL